MKRTMAAKNGESTPRTRVPKVPKKGEGTSHSIWCFFAGWPKESQANPLGIKTPRAFLFHIGMTPCFMQIIGKAAKESGRKKDRAH